MIQHHKKIYFFCLLALLFFPLSVFSNKVEDKNKLHFLMLSDIHFDPFTSCKNQKPCPLIQSLRLAPVKQWSTILSLKDNKISVYRQNTTYALLHSTLEAASELAKKNHVQFVTVLGDSLGHHYRKYYKQYSGDYSYAGYQSFVRKTMEFLEIELAHAFPSLSVYMVVGNNDSYHYDYAAYPGGQFFRDMVLIWSKLIKNPANANVMRNEFSTAGYYAVNLSPGLRLIILNSVLFSNKARGPGIEKAAINQLQWFRQQLASAKQNKQKVLIAMHIPPGIDIYANLKYRLLRMIELWKHDYTLDYEQSLQEFAFEIAGVFVGHLHTDWMQMLTLGNMGSIPVIGTPSVSPIYGNSPGFKIFTYSNKTNELVDFRTYYYFFDKNNAWSTKYSFH